MFYLDNNPSLFKLIALQTEINEKLVHREMENGGFDAGATTIYTHP